MSYYEYVLLMRHNLVSAEIDRVVDDLSKLIKEYNGEVIKNEYWGLRSLAYEISGDKKAHYYLMGIKADNSLLQELTRKTRLMENVLRHSIVRVDEISKSPSPVLKGKFSNEDAIDVTIKKAAS